MEPHFDGIWSGEGSRLFGGRFNPRGRPAVYASNAFSLAFLETLVRLNVEDGVKIFRVAAVEVPADAIEDASALLSENWRTNETATRALGDEWLTSGRSLALQVPTAVLPYDLGEGNLLLNPRHPTFDELGFGESRDFRIDQRLFRTA